MAANFAVPVDILGRVEGLGLEADQFERIRLPLNSWVNHAETIKSNPKIQDSLYSAKHDLISEVTLRDRVWDGLIKEMVHSLDCFEMELDAKSFQGTKSVCKVDLAVVAKEARLPVLIVEISKNKPKKGICTRTLRR